MKKDTNSGGAARTSRKSSGKNAKRKSREPTTPSALKDDNKCAHPGPHLPHGVWATILTKLHGQDLAAAACASTELQTLAMDEPGTSAQAYIVAKSLKSVPGASEGRDAAIEDLRNCLASNNVGRTYEYAGYAMSTAQANEWAQLVEHVDREMVVLATKKALSRGGDDDEEDTWSMKRKFCAVSITGLGGQRLSFAAETFEESEGDDWTDVYALTMFLAPNDTLKGKKRRRAEAAAAESDPRNTELHRLVTYESVRVEDFDDEVRNRRPTAAAVRHLRNGMGVKHLTDGQLLYFVLTCCGVQCIYEQWVLDLDRHISLSDHGDLEANLTPAQVSKWHAERERGVLACWPTLPHMRFSPLCKAAERERIASTDPPRSGTGGGLQLLPAVEAAMCGIAGRLTRSLSRRLSSPAVPQEAFEAASAIGALAIASKDRRVMTARAMASPLDQLRNTMAEWEFPKKEFSGYPSGWDLSR